MDQGALSLHRFEVQEPEIQWLQQDLWIQNCRQAQWDRCCQRDLWGLRLLLDLEVLALLGLLWLQWVHVRRLDLSDLESPASIP